MSERQYVSPVQVARALGMSETTVKRWVDEGKLPARRTAGGHRKILCSDVLDLASRENWPIADLSVLTGAVKAACLTDTHAAGQQLHEAILSDDLGTARGVIEGLREGGLSFARLGDEVISPVMAQVGHGWASGSLDVYQEHRGTLICLASLHGLPRPAAGEGRPVAVGGGPEGDHSQLANVLIELMLSELGWRVVNIGPNTPFASFRLALRQHRPRLFWLSCSHEVDEGAFLEGYGPVYEEALALGAAVAVGGRALTEGLRSRMKYTHHGDRLAHLEAFANQLWPGPQGRVGV